jgi:ribokinase
MSGRVVVVGSVNIDRVFCCPALPAPGETVLASGAALGFGGKGGNQAAAAARFGAPTWLVAAVGDDGEGALAGADLRRFGVAVDYVRVVAGQPTGQAAVLTGPGGDNLIAVAGGANLALTGVDVRSALAGLGLAAGEVVLVSAEVAEEVAQECAAGGAAAGGRVIYNVAPARPLSGWVAEHRPLLVLNEVEAAQVGGVADAVEAAARLAGVSGGAVVTRGALGAVCAAGGAVEVVPAPVPPRVVDSTGAGDAFCGVLAAALAAGWPLLRAVRTAVAAGAYAVTAAGARGALPRPEDLR